MRIWCHYKAQPQTSYLTQERFRKKWLNPGKCPALAYQSGMPARHCTTPLKMDPKSWAAEPGGHWPPTILTGGPGPPTFLTVLFFWPS